MNKTVPPLGRANWLTPLCSFFLPVLLMGLVFAFMGVYPFGESSLLIIDMNSEYVDYLAQMNESVRTGGSLLRTWNMGMGLGMLGLIAFYTSSPFNLLVLLFPVTCITEVIFAITLLKLGLAGLLFTLYTRYVMDLPRWLVVCFSVAYALCGYNIAYASNIMWLDGAAFLPLVLLGAEKILRENRFRLFLFSLVYVFFTSYYIGYMIGLFAFLYFTAVWFSKSNDLRTYLCKLARFLGAAVAAAGCCAFLLLPAFFGLRNGQSAMWDIQMDWTVSKPFVHIASRLLPGVYDTLTTAGYPNIYCTVLAVLLCMCFFTGKTATRREKIVFGSLLGFLFLSFSWVFLDLAWHAFEDPTWFPARYSFVFCFLVLYLAMRAAKDLERLSAVGAVGAATLFTLLMVEVGIGGYRYMTLWNLAAAGLLLAVYGLLWALWRKKGWRWLPAGLLLLVCAETAGNALVMELHLDDQFGYKTRDSYYAFREEYGAATAAVQAQDTGVYRMELLEQRNANGGMALGYNGISHYSTTTDQALNAFLRRLGYNRGTENELRFARSTPLTNGLLGIKYVLAKEDLGSGYTLVGTVGDVDLYQNDLVFPLAFWTSADTGAFQGTEEDPFQLQNRWLESLSLGSPFSPVAVVEDWLYNTDRTNEGSHFIYTPLVSSKSAAVEFYVTNPTGHPVYAFFPVWNRRFSTADFYVDSVFVQHDLRYRNNSIVTMGDGEESRLTVKLGGSMSYVRDHYFYTLDLAAAETAAATAWTNAVNFAVFEDTRVQGTVTAPADGVIATTFPLDSGWTVRVDGQKTDTTAHAGVFLAVPVSQGEHTLEFHYSPPGFFAGCIISLLSVTILIVLRFINVLL